MNICRNSPQRDAVLQAVLGSCDHPTAETLYERVRETLPNISLGTVYRNLAQLCEAGKVRRVAVGGGSCRFDRTLATHAHFYCRRCQQVTDISNDVAASIESEVEKATGHEVENQELLFSGVCTRCKNAANQENMTPDIPSAELQGERYGN